MKISRLMEQHQKYQAQGLSDNFGDGYLVANNRIYRQIREAALAAGYKFSSEQNKAYEAFPLLQLEPILKTKTVPYSNNIAAFEQMTPVQLDLITWEEIEGNLKQNFVFHEGCHSAVRALAEKTLKIDSKGDTLEAHRYMALRMLLEESCSNTAELLGVIDANDQVHRLFYELASYVVEFENRTNLKNAMTEMGSDVVVPFMVLAYLHSNFLRESLAAEDLDVMLAIVTDKTLTTKQVKTLKALSKIAFQLSERFRYQTTSFHLRLAGVKTPIEELFNFNFLHLLKSEPGFRLFLAGFAEILKL